jgi:hypothetical protein
VKGEEKGKWERENGVRLKENLGQLSIRRLYIKQLQQLPLRHKRPKRSHKFFQFE